MIKSQLLMHVILYLAVLVITYILVKLNTIKVEYAIWFVVLVAVEVASQEAHRYLIALEKPLLSNAILFIKGGLWVYLLFICQIIGRPISLEGIWTLWSLFGALAASLASYFIGRSVGWRRILSSRVNMAWLLQGLRVTVLFFISSLSYRYVKYIDKIAIQIYTGETQVGVYAFYSNIAVAMEAFVMSGVVIILFPKMIRTYGKNKELYTKYYNQLKLSIIVASTVISITIYYSIPYILKIVNKQQYIANIELVVPITATAYIYNLSLLYHYALYAQRNDKAIVFSALVFAIVSTVLLWVLVPLYGTLGAAWSTVMASAVHLLLKYQWVAKARNGVKRRGSW